MPDCRCPVDEFNIDQDKFDQDRYWGRVKHFFQVTNPFNLLASSARLERARTIVLKVRSNEYLPDCYSTEELWHEKRLYDSAYHPSTGQKMSCIGKMSAQASCNMILLAGLMTFYKTRRDILIWHGLYNTFLSVVNYTNRGTDEDIHEGLVVGSFVLAAGSGVGLALGLSKIAGTLPVVARKCIPLITVSLVNCINLPLMRSHELLFGTPVYDACNKKLGNSKKAAESALLKVLACRMTMITPGLILSPLMMEHFSRQGLLCAYPWLPLPTRMGLIGLCHVFSTPLSCAMFRQICEVKFQFLENEARKEIMQHSKCRYHPPRYVYYNRGLCREPLHEYVPEAELWRAKSLYDSAYNPQTGERLSFFGRAANQIPCASLILGSMLTFQGSSAAIVFWQWIYQTYNTLSFMKSRGSQMSVSDRQVATQYVLSTAAAIGTALGLHGLTKQQKCPSPLLMRFIPLAAIMAANCISVPLLKSQELKYGTPIFDEHGKKLGYSTNAAAAGINHNLLNRFALIAPGMIVAPILLDVLEKQGTICRYPWLPFPANVGVMMFCLAFVAPFTCALLKRKGELKFRHLERDLQDELRARFDCHPPKYVYFDKGK